MSNGLIRIEDLHDSIKIAASDNTQTTTSEVTRLNCLNKNLVSLVMTGKTIVNTLGTIGDFEDVTQWNTSMTNCTVTLDNTFKVFGSNSIKAIRNITGQQDIGFRSSMPFPINNTKYYGLSIYAKNSNSRTVSGATIYTKKASDGNTIIVGIGNIPNMLAGEVKRVWRKFAPTDLTNETSIYLYPYAVALNQNEYMNYDCAMLEEISEADYNNPNWTPSPYVTNDTSVGDTAGRIKSIGKNKFSLIQGSTIVNSAGINGTLAVNITDRLTHKYGGIVVKPNTTYTLSMNPALYCKFSEIDEARQVISDSGYTGTTVTTSSFTTGNNTKFLGINLKLIDGTPIYPDGYQVQLEEGDTPTTYESYQETVMPIPYPLRSLPSGVADIQDTKKGKIYKKIEKLILDGSLNWSFYSNNTGFKMVAILGNFTNALDGRGKILKFNNKSLSYVSAWDLADVFEINYGKLGNLAITIANSDSGWGDSYTPTPEEIKAYFNGWKMYDFVHSGDGSGVYAPNVSGAVKGWCYRGGNGILLGGTTTLPTTLATGYTPYRLYYQLATPQEIDMPFIDLVGLPNGSLIMENDAQSWVRPTVSYTLNKNSRANLEDAINQAARLNTYKPLNGVYCTTQNITYYVDATKGDDINNNGLSPDKPFKTIMKAINSLPQVVNHVVKIYIANGTYDEDVIFEGFTGKGTIYLYGSTVADDTRVLSRLQMISCGIYVYARGFKFTSNYDGDILIEGCIRVRLEYMKIQPPSLSGTNSGILSDFSKLNVNNCIISNKYYAIAINNMTELGSYNNSGSGNTFGLNSTSGTIFKNGGSQPTATTAELTSQGGVIR